MRMRVGTLFLLICFGAAGSRAAPGRAARAGLGQAGRAPAWPPVLAGGVLLVPLWPLAPALLAAGGAPDWRPQCDLSGDGHSIGDAEDVEDREHDYKPTPKPRRPATPRTASRRPASGSDPTERRVPARTRPEQHAAPDAAPYPAYVRAAALDQAAASPPLARAVSSKDLLEKFRIQAPTAPELPPALLSEHDASERVPRPEHLDPVDVYSAGVADPPAVPPPVPASAPHRGYLPTSDGDGLSSEPNARPRSPPRPKFDRSMLLRGALTVTHADYTEPYTAWWDSASGSARIDFHGGSASTFRTISADGSVQLFETRVDRSGEQETRRCGQSRALAAAAADRAPPALPDMELFSFAGYEQSESGPVERWTHTLEGRDGELGGARGEALTYHHELLLTRGEGLGHARPLRYRVAVHSSLLGARCDGYEHRYHHAAEHTQHPDFFVPNIDDMCDIVEYLNTTSGEEFARLDPLREFTLPHRDLRYDAALQRFKTEYNRDYVDDVEEALRKTLLIQHTRFTESANREGATFELAVNFLGDRLDAELHELLGVTAAAERTRAERFPHARADLRAQAPSLPERFDWRPRGAVSPVKYQGSCSSCWAFAVAGAVEGALFVRTRALTPLAEKALVDCAHPFGGNGCGGTWPSHAFDYVQSRGLPAAEDYPPYEDKVAPCADAPPVTRISAHVNVTANDVTALKVAIRSHAPTVVIIDAKAKSFVFYKKGVLYDDRCAKAPRQLNHAVLAVGWGQRRGEPHFILKNSWSEAWGERGYVRLQARANTCGVLASPSYPRLERADVLRSAPRPRRGAGRRDGPV